MRLWSIHPKYLDTKGLVALWREGLLARKVLLAQTNGYRNHPQLERFKLTDDPVTSIDYYLTEVFKEAERRGYTFDCSKINPCLMESKIKVTTGQIQYELEHLKRKLLTRDPAKYQELCLINGCEAHPCFEMTVGEVASWEVTK